MKYCIRILKDLRTQEQKLLARARQDGETDLQEWEIEIRAITTVIGLLEEQVGREEAVSAIAASSDF